MVHLLSVVVQGALFGQLAVNQHSTVIISLISNEVACGSWVNHVVAISIIWLDMPTIHCKRWALLLSSLLIAGDIAILWQ